METPTEPKQVKKRRLTKKQRGFVNDYADTGNGTQSVLKNYNIGGKHGTNQPEVVAANVATEILSKPYIQEELRKLGFDSNNAKRVISEILNDETLEPKDRIKAAENVFKVQGDYAPDRTVNINVEVEASDELKKAAELLNEHFRNGGTSDGVETVTVGTETQSKE